MRWVKMNGRWPLPVHEGPRWFWFRLRARWDATAVLVSFSPSRPPLVDACHAWAVDGVKTGRGWIAGPIAEPRE